MFLKFALGIAQTCLGAFDGRWVAVVVALELAQIGACKRNFGLECPGLLIYGLLVGAHQVWCRLAGSSLSVMKRLFGTRSATCASYLLLRPTLANRALLSSLKAFDAAVGNARSLAARTGAEHLLRRALRT